MAALERVREPLEGSLDPQYVKQRETAGWRLVGVEWEREAEASAATGEREPRLEEPPYGVRVGGTAITWKKIPTRCSPCFP